MWNGQSVGVVFPAYNEAQNIAIAIAEFRDLVGADQSPLVDSIVVVDNNSTDGTGDLARGAGAQVIVETKQGYGNALQRGLGEIDTDIIVLCEPDGTFACKDIVKLLAYSEDFEMVCGTRTNPGMIWDEANMKWFLRLGNYFVAKGLEILYKTRSLSDCGCTFRLIRKESARRLQSDLFVGASHFLPNMIIAAKMNGVDFIEVPVSYRGRTGESKITGSWLGMWKTGIAMIWLILAYWPRFLFRVSDANPKPTTKRFD
jgi:glycosyltransferase involved in cell wall biosynthesis